MSRSTFLICGNTLTQFSLSLSVSLSLRVCPSAGVSESLDSYCSLKPLCSGMGEVVPARTSPTLLPPSPRTVLSLSCFKVLQCINCRDWHCKSYRKTEVVVQLDEIYGGEMNRHSMHHICLKSHWIKIQL